MAYGRKQDAIITKVFHFLYVPCVNAEQRQNAIKKMKRMKADEILKLDQSQLLSMAYSK